MTIALLVVYLLVLLGIAIYGARKGTTYDYLISSRDLGPLALGTSISAGFFDSFVLVSFTAYVYSFGWPALSLFVGTAGGLILFSRFARRLRAEAEVHQYYGMSDYFEQRYGHSAAVLVSGINVVFYLALLLIQVIFGSTLLSDVTGIAYPLCVSLVSGTLLVYVGIGGFRAVTATDIFQWSLILVLLVLVLSLLFDSETVRALGRAEWGGAAGDAVGFLLIGTMASFSAPELWQRCFAAKDENAARRGTLLAAMLFPAAGLALAVVGFSAAAHFPGIDPQTALIRVFRDSLSAGLDGVALVLLLAAIMSTADTCLFVIAPTIALNVVRSPTAQESRAPTFWIMASSLVLAAVGALFVQDILKVALALAGLSLGIFPVLIVGQYKVLSARVVLVAMATGVAVVLAALAGGSLDPTTSVLSFPASFLVVASWAIVQKFRGRLESVTTYGVGAGVGVGPSGTAGGALSRDRMGTQPPNSESSE